MTTNRNEIDITERALLAIDEAYDLCRESRRSRGRAALIAERIRGRCLQIKPHRRPAGEQISHALAPISAMMGSGMMQVVVKIGVEADEPPPDREPR